MKNMKQTVFFVGLALLLVLTASGCKKGENKENSTSSTEESAISEEESTISEKDDIEYLDFNDYENYDEFAKALCDYFNISEGDLEYISQKYPDVYSVLTMTNKEIYQSYIDDDDNGKHYNELMDLKYNCYKNGIESVCDLSSGVSEVEGDLYSEIYNTLFELSKDQSVYLFEHKLDEYTSRFVDNIVGVYNLSDEDIDNLKSNPKLLLAGIMTNHEIEALYSPIDSIIYGEMVKLHKEFESKYE